MYAGTKAPRRGLGPAALRRRAGGTGDDHRAGPGRPGAEERRHHPRLPPGGPRPPRVRLYLDVPPVRRGHPLHQRVERDGAGQPGGVGAGPAGQAGDEGRRGGPSSPASTPSCSRRRWGRSWPQGKRPPPSPRWPWWAIPSASATPPRHPPAGRGGPRGQPAAQRGGQRPRPAAPGGVGAARAPGRGAPQLRPARPQAQQGDRGLPGAPGPVRGESAGDRGAPASRGWWGGGHPPLRLHHPYPGRPPRPAGGRLRPHAGGRGPLQRRRPGRDGGAGRPGGRPAPGGAGRGARRGSSPGTGRTTPRGGTPCSPRRSPTASGGPSPCTATGPGRLPGRAGRGRRVQGG